jgi:hypothetical protein
VRPLICIYFLSTIIVAIPPSKAAAALLLNPSFVNITILLESDITILLVSIRHGCLALPPAFPFFFTTR